MKPKSETRKAFERMMLNGRLNELMNQGIQEGIAETEKARRGFVRLGHWFDRLMGAVLVGLGIKVAFSELH